jgi:uncharacterized membrane protein
MIRTGLIASALLIALMAAISAYGFSAIAPDALVASHWNLAGEADRFAPRDTILIGLPLVALALALIFAVVPIVDPRKDHVASSRGLFLSAWIGSLGMLAAAHAAIVSDAALGLVAPPRLIFGAVGAFFVVLGNFMAKSRSSWFIGLRTPWTMSSENAWIAANRTAGALFVLAGAATIGAAVLSDARMTVSILIAGVLTAALAGVVVSYLAWRADPDRAR